MDATQIYEALIAPNASPRWPGTEVQRHYTGAFGPQIVRSALSFIDMLDRDGAFAPDWRGLDYGAGFGRIASLLLSKGNADQLDLADAWDVSIQRLREGKFANRIISIPELLSPEDLPTEHYDFAYAFSVFTHFAAEPFGRNLTALAASVKPGGKLYITVRQEDLLRRNYPDLAEEAAMHIAEHGWWFKPTRGDLGTAAIFGEMVVSESFLFQQARAIGAITYLGQIQLQHVYRIAKAPEAA